MRIGKLFIVGAAAVGIAAVGHTVPLTEDFAAGGDDWTLTADPAGPAIGSPTDEASFAGRSGVVKITVADDETGYDRFFADSGSALDFVGNYATGTGLENITAAVQGIKFDFYVDPAGPISELSIFLRTTSEHEWYWILDDAVVTGWNTYGANVSATDADTGFGVWQPEIGTYDWQTDIADIAQIGISFGYLSAGSEQIYAIDSFTIQEEPFLVPEPETYAFLAMAILALGLVFRKQVDESLRAAFAHVRV